MKILLLGEYSNVHHTLSQGLKALGHQVTLVSDGDGWKDYPRDIDIRRKSMSFCSSFLYYVRLKRLFRKLRGYDIVQIINPIFLPLKAKRIWSFYHDLRKYNRKVFMGAFGMDYYYIQACLDTKTFRYSDFNFGKLIRRYPDAQAFLADWYEGEKGVLNQYIARDCDGIVAGLYEYYAAYRHEFSNKLQFIPFPLCCKGRTITRKEQDPIKFFIGIQKKRNLYKGTDIMYDALLRVKQKYPKECIILKAESVPFQEYVKMFKEADVILDQLYSYTPAMNALEAMSNGIVVVGGGEPENYDILKESTLRPIVNVFPSEQDVYEKLCWLIDNRQLLPKMQQDSIAYIEKHHDYKKVAAQYIDFWSK